MRVLQLGPGDFCRLAFQPVRGQSEYEILYGGDPPTEALPPWTARDGLLLETRHYRECNLQKLEKVRAAFEAASPIGSDYVGEVRHACNPLTLKQGPFLSRYSGTLHIDVAGSYRIFTSSQDCSFLLIDDKLVISAPGRHGPTGDGTRHLAANQALGRVAKVRILPRRCRRRRDHAGSLDSPSRQSQRASDGHRRRGPSRPTWWPTCRPAA